MELFEAKARILALRNQLDRLAGEAKKDVMAHHLGLPQQKIYHNTDPLKTMSLFERFASLRDSLKAERPALFADLPSRPLPDPPNDTPGACSGRGAIRAETSELWISDMGYCLEIISSVEERPASSMKVTSEGVYFAGQYFDALQRFNEIVSIAKKSVSIIDGYVNESVLSLLTGKASGVTVEILTFQVSPSLQTAAVAFNKQYNGLSIRTSKDFHDRFVFIDDTDFYHFGASIKDLANRGFMFSRIQESSVVNALRNRYSTVWVSASVVL